MNQLISYCKNIYPISAELEKTLIHDSIAKKYKAGDFILREGFTANYTCFIVDGLVRSFYYKIGAILL